MTPSKTSAITPRKWQSLLLRWFDQHGRKHLPWQQNKSPYRVWVSEIMLQQTQVTTVIPYFERFMTLFPTLADLANAETDQLMHAWAGLGYYSRARNLHKAAIKIMQDFHGQFPSHVDDLIALAGIGPSTAGAISAIAFQQHAAILDGNVKRVLARAYGITDAVNVKAGENKLWAIAVQNTPVDRVADYTQAMMDLGATICTRSKPSCTACPMQKQCYAHLHGMETVLPKKKAAKAIPTKATVMLVIQSNNRILLTKRPSKGIWGGLWSLPELHSSTEPADVIEHCLRYFHLPINHYRELPAFRHTFSHYHLSIQPILLVTNTAQRKVMAEDDQIWYNLANPQPIGLPKPIQTLLRSLK